MPVYLVDDNVKIQELDAIVTADYSTERQKIKFSRNIERMFSFKDKSKCKYYITAYPLWYETNNKSIEEYYRDIVVAASKKSLYSILFRLENIPSNELRNVYGIMRKFATENIRVFLMTSKDYFASLPQNTRLQNIINEKYSPEIKFSLKLDEEYQKRLEAEYLKRLEEAKPIVNNAKKLSLSDFIKKTEISFSEHLFRIIDEKGMDEVECYKRANVARSTFSKIRSDREYQPSKKTVFAFAVALKLDYDRTQFLLKSAGYSFSHSSKMDLIVEYYIINGQYDIFEINNALYAFGQPLLGA